MIPPNHRHWLPRLLGLWAIPTLITFAAMLTHRSDNPALLGRYSVFVAAMLAGLLLFVAALIGAALALRGRSALLARVDALLRRWRSRRWFALLILVATGIALAGMWGFFLGDHLITYALLRLFLGATLAIGALAILFGGEAAPAPARWTPLALIVLAGLFLLALALVEFYPAMYRTDEAFIFSMARHLAESGHNGPTIYRHVIPQDYGAGGLWTWGMAAWLRVVGSSLFSGRLYILLVGLVGLAVTVAAARRGYGAAAGWLTALVGLFAVTALHYIRNDMPGMVFLGLALFFFVLGQQRRDWRLHLLVGLSAGLCIDAAPIAYCFGLGFGLFYLARYIAAIRTQRRWFWPPFWALAAGGALALGIYLLFRSGASYAASPERGGGIADMLSAYVGSLGAALASGSALDLLQQVLTTWLTNQPILFGLAALGVIVAARERTDLDRLLLVLLATWLGVIVFTYHYFPVLYLVHGLPVALLLAGRGVTGGLPLLLQSAPAGMNALGRAAALLLAVWLLAALAHNVAGLSSSSLEDVVQAGREIAQIVPQDSVVVAAEPYYFGMLDHRNFVGGAVEGMLVQWQGRTPGEAWEIVAPDAVIFSERWAEPPHTPALLAYMQDHAFALVGCWQRHPMATWNCGWREVLPVLRRTRRVRRCVCRAGARASCPERPTASGCSALTQKHWVCRPLTAGC